MLTPEKIIGILYNNRYHLMTTDKVVLDFYNSKIESDNRHFLEAVNLSVRGDLREAVGGKYTLSLKRQENDLFS